MQTGCASARITSVSGTSRSMATRWSLCGARVALRHRRVGDHPMTDRMTVSDRHSQHWPSNVERDDCYFCYCGHQTDTAIQMFRHVQTWNRAMSPTRGPSTWKRVVGISIRINESAPTHLMTRRQSILKRTKFRISCSCGWDTGWRSDRGVKAARLHVEMACCTVLGLDIGAVKRGAE
jgi:hypothetical protein